MNVLILTSDAGGGHRSVARALAAGFQEVGGDGCQVQVVDYLAAYAPFPLSRAQQLYAFLMRYPALWGAFYASTNTTQTRAWNAPALGLALEAGMDRLLRDCAPDVIVSTHPMAAPALTGLRYRRGRELPFYTVVTDYGFLHTWWAYPFGELWFAPSSTTAAHLMRLGIPPERVIISGYPVHPRFARPSAPAPELRQALGLQPDRFALLLVGGAEGVGPLEEIVHALAARPAPWQLNVVTGRNHTLRERLQARAARWAIPVRIDGQVDDMPTRMHAADLLLTKAGGSTTSEAFACQVPMLLIHALPGQEEENVRHFQLLGVARHIEEPLAIRAAVEELARPGSLQLEAMRTRLRQMPHPPASIEIARHVLGPGREVTAWPAPPFFSLQYLRARTASVRANWPWHHSLR